VAEGCPLMFLAEHKRFRLSQRLLTLQMYEWSLSRNSVPDGKRRVMVILAHQTLTLTWGRLAERLDNLHDVSLTRQRLAAATAARVCRTRQVWRRLQDRFERAPTYSGLEALPGCRRCLQAMPPVGCWRLIRFRFERSLVICGSVAHATAFLDRE